MHDNYNEEYGEEQFQDDLLAVLSGWCDLDDTALDTSGSDIRTYENAGVLTYNKGLVIRLGNGTEFQLTIVQTN